MYCFLNLVYKHFENLSLISLTSEAKINTNLINLSESETIDNLTNIKKVINNKNEKKINTNWIDLWEPETIYNLTNLKKANHKIKDSYGKMNSQMYQYIRYKLKKLYDMGLNVEIYYIGNTTTYNIINAVGFIAKLNFDSKMLSQIKGDIPHAYLMSDGMNSLNVISGFLQEQKANGSSMKMTMDNKFHATLSFVEDPIAIVNIMYNIHKNYIIKDTIEDLKHEKLIQTKISSLNTTLVPQTFISDFVKTIATDEVNSTIKFNESKDINSISGGIKNLDLGTKEIVNTDHLIKQIIIKDNRAFIIYTVFFSVGKKGQIEVRTEYLTDELFFQARNIIQQAYSISYFDSEQDVSSLVDFMGIHCSRLVHFKSGAFINTVVMIDYINGKSKITEINFKNFKKSHASQLYNFLLNHNIFIGSEFQEHDFQAFSTTIEKYIGGKPTQSHFKEKDGIILNIFGPNSIRFFEILKEPIAMGASNQFCLKLKPLRFTAYGVMGRLLSIFFEPVMTISNFLLLAINISLSYFLTNTTNIEFNFESPCPFLLIPLKREFKRKELKISLTISYKNFSFNININHFDYIKKLKDFQNETAETFIKNINYNTKDELLNIFSKFEEHSQTNMIENLKKMLAGESSLSKDYNECETPIATLRQILNLEPNYSDHGLIFDKEEWENFFKKEISVIDLKKSFFNFFRTIKGPEYKKFLNHLTKISMLINEKIEKSLNILKEKNKLENEKIQKENIEIDKIIETKKLAGNYSEEEQKIDSEKKKKLIPEINSIDEEEKNKIVTESMLDLKNYNNKEEIKTITMEQMFTNQANLQRFLQIEDKQNRENSQNISFLQNFTEDQKQDLTKLKNIIQNFKREEKQQWNNALKETDLFKTINKLKNKNSEFGANVSFSYNLLYKQIKNNLWFGTFDISTKTSFLPTGLSLTKGTHWMRYYKGLTSTLSGVFGFSLDKKGHIQNSVKIGSIDLFGLTQYLSLDKNKSGDTIEHINSINHIKLAFTLKYFLQSKPLWDSTPITGISLLKIRMAFFAGMSLLRLKAPEYEFIKKINIFKDFFQFIATIGICLMVDIFNGHISFCIGIRLNKGQIVITFFHLQTPIQPKDTDQQMYRTFSK